MVILNPSYYNSSLCVRAQDNMTKWKHQKGQGLSQVRHERKLHLDTCWHATTCQQALILVIKGEQKRLITTDTYFILCTHGEVPLLPLSVYTTWLSAAYLHRVVHSSQPSLSFQLLGKKSSSSLTVLPWFVSASASFLSVENWRLWFVTGPLTSYSLGQLPPLSLSSSPKACFVSLIQHRECPF